MIDDVQTPQPEVTEQQPTEQQAQQAKEEVKQQESQKETNFRLLRERAEQAERRALELERMIQANMSQNQPSQKMQVEEDDDDLGISDDTYIEGKHLKKYVKSLKQELKNTRKQFEEYNQKTTLDQAEMRLKGQFTDFDSVVSRENLEKLASAKPALYRSIMATNDIYDRGYTAYEMIKASGLIGEPYTQTDKKLEENKSKPRSAANAGPQTAETPLVRVGDYDRRVLTEERKEQLRRQVEEAKRLR
jgi:hypothetical protein